MDRTSQKPSSLEQMAQEIFSLTVMGWRQRVASRQPGGPELSESQYLTVETIANAPGTLTVGEIQRSIGVLPAQMSRIIRSLESGFDKPLIRCELNQTDKRRIDVHMTPEGRRAFQEFRQSWILPETRNWDRGQGLPSNYLAVRGALASRH